MSSPAGLYRGTVARLDGGVYVTVPRLGRGAWGPLPILEGPWSGLLTGTGAGPDAHTHPAGAELAVGDRVLVGLIEGRVNDLVILGRLA